MQSLTKISNSLGISRTTVSLVLNGKGNKYRISEETQKKILDYCNEKNYRPNINAQRMNRRIVKNIAVLFYASSADNTESSFSDYILTHILGGISSAADKHGFTVSLQTYHRGMDPQLIFNNFRNRAIDGLINYGIEMPNEWQQTLIKEGRCVVGISVTPGPLLTVNPDNFTASKELTRHLIRQGRRHFYYLCGSKISYPGQESYRGFLAALHESHISFNEKRYRAWCNFSEENSFRTIKKAIENKIPIDAVVCANDRMAIGAVRALQEHGLAVPEKVSVTGSDNIELSRYTIPALTTFDLHPQKLGYQAAELLFRKIEEKAVKDIKIPCELVFR